MSVDRVSYDPGVALSIIPISLVRLGRGRVAVVEYLKHARRIALILLRAAQRAAATRGL